MNFRADLCTTGKLLELLQWIADRAEYRRVCGITDPAAYSAECSAEREIYAELQRRSWPNI